MLSHKFNNCPLSLGGGGVLPYMASMGMCCCTGYGLRPLCPKAGYIVWHRLFAVPYFFVRSFRYTTSYRHGYLDFQITEGSGVGDYSYGGEGGPDK